LKGQAEKFVEDDMGRIGCLLSQTSFKELLKNKVYYCLVLFGDII